MEAGLFNYFFSRATSVARVFSCPTVNKKSPYNRADCRGFVVLCVIISVKESIEFCQIAIYLNQGNLQSFQNSLHIFLC